jgi:hypothetical protein
MNTNPPISFIHSFIHLKDLVQMMHNASVACNNWTTIYLHTNCGQSTYLHLHKTLSKQEMHTEYIKNLSTNMALRRIILKRISDKQAMRM